MRPRVRQSLLAAFGAGLLAVAFYGYLRPAFIVDVANRLWLCL